MRRGEGSIALGGNPRRDVQLQITLVPAGFIGGVRFDLLESLYGHSGERCYADGRLLTIDPWWAAGLAGSADRLIMVTTAGESGARVGCL